MMVTDWTTAALAVASGAAADGAGTMSVMEVRSDSLGDVDVEDDKILFFPEGLVGFPDARHFAMVLIEDGPYVWLQSLDDPALTFLSVIPWAFFPDYEPEIDPSSQQSLALEDASDAILLCLVSIRDDDDEPITANLVAPVVVNIRTRQGRQVVLSDSDLALRAPLAANA